MTDLRIVHRPLAEGRREELIALFGEDAFPGLRAGMTRQLVEVDFEIRSADLQLDPETAQVSLAQDGLLGGYLLRLDPGYWEGERESALEEHTDQIRIASREGTGLDAVFARLAPAIDSLSQALDPDDPQGLHSTVLQPLNDLIASADETLTVFRKRLLEDALVQAETLIQDGSALVANVEQLTNEVGVLVKDLNPRALKLIDDLDSTTRNLGQSIVRIEEDMSATMKMTQEILQENRPELAESLRRLRRTMWEAEMAMRKIRANPAYLVFGDDETLFDASEVDAGEILRSGRARPYEQRDEQDDGE